MHVTTQFESRQIDSSPSLKIVSLPGFLTIVIGVGIIAIGIREFLQPSVGARGYGVSLADMRDAPFLAIKAGRDVAVGILALTFLAQANRRILATTMGVLALIPICDGLIVFREAQWVFTPTILVHWGTAAVMLIIVALLRRQ